MYEFTLSDQEQRLMQMGGSFLAFKLGAVNIDDLLCTHPGKVVRCTENPGDVIRVFAQDNAALGCVAGWMSEAE